MTGFVYIVQIGRRAARFVVWCGVWLLVLTSLRAVWLYWQTADPIWSKLHELSALAYLLMADMCVRLLEPLPDPPAEERDAS